ncbi:hypothetical protein M0805_007666 [Coniferiporia weirii]|nr:hypothetical protein M0805_007666 [Coniferiporia weirii]
MMPASAPMNIAHRRTPSAFFSPPLAPRSVSSQCGTSWSESFDFASRSPLTSALHLSTSPMSVSIPMPVPCSPRFSADYYSFERDYCSNFACCGLTLPDMHALVAHFEDTHVVLSDEYGLPIRRVSAPAVPMPDLARQHTCTYPPSAAAAGAPNSATTTTTTDFADVLGMDVLAGVMDASPHSSVGPETPPAAHVQAYAFPNASNAFAPSPMYSPSSSSGSGSSSLFSSAHPSPISPSSGSAHSPFSTHSPYYPGSEEDVLMHFEPLDADVDACTAPARDSTPPSPLAASVRPGSVLRSAVAAAAVAAEAAAAAANGGAGAQPVCLPPALFSAPSRGASRAGTPSPGGVVRRERERERERERARKGPMALLGACAAVGAGAKARARLSGAGVSSPGGSGSEGERTGGEESEAGDAAATATATAMMPAQSAGGKRQREKAYRCTKPGCTKSYLNPNGLKYHNSKGTCTFAVSPSASASASNSKASSPAPSPSTPAALASTSSSSISNGDANANANATSASVSASIAMPTTTTMPMSMPMSMSIPTTAAAAPPLLVYAPAPGRVGMAPGAGAGKSARRAEVC